MESVKYSPEEQAEIDRDRERPHCVVTLCFMLSSKTVFQNHISTAIEDGMANLKARADRAGMQILSTSVSTNVSEMNGSPSLVVMVLCQWASIEKLREMQLRANLTGGR